MNPLNTNDMLVVTIVIQMHGTVITYELNPETANIFDNVRLLCKAGGLQEYVSGQSGLPGLTEEIMLVSNLRQIFEKDIDLPTYDIISNAKSGILLGNITFDKTLSTNSGDVWDITKYLQGIYLLSIHRGGNLIYPTKSDEKVINFLKVNDLQRLVSFFNKKSVPNLEIPNLENMSTPFPDQNIYIKRVESVKSNSKLNRQEKKEKIEEIKEEYMNLIYKWDLTLDKKGNIEDIKLSSLVELVKKILGNQIIINLLDYSCNAPTSYISKKQSSQYAILEDDIEMGTPHKEYGGKKKKTRRRSKKKHTKKRRNKKIKSRYR
jgi:hypothetical protein